MLNSMKKGSIFGLFIMLLLVSCKTTQPDLSMTPSAINGDRWLIENDKGKVTGYIEQDRIDKRRMMVYDKDGYNYYKKK
jgi:hypothetical protein